MHIPKVPIVIVAGIEKTSRAIGKENGLLWHVPADMKRFKVLTLGHPVIMGRKTYESILEILGRPLPGRTNIVITRNKAYEAQGVMVTTSLNEAIEEAIKENPKEIHIGGGSEIYKQVLPFTSRLHLTLFDDPEVAGDTFFPPYEDDFVATTQHEAETHEGISYQWIDYARK